MEEQKTALTTHLIPNLPKLLQKYLPDAEKVSHLLKLIQHFDLNLYTIMRQERCLDNLLKLIQEVIERHVDSKVIKAAAEALESLCDENISIGTRCKTVASRIIDNTIEKYYEAVEENDTSMVNEESSCPNLLIIVKKLSTIAPYFDLSRREIFQEMTGRISGFLEMVKDDEVTEEVIEQQKYFMEITTMHLHWRRVELMKCHRDVDEHLKSLENEFGIYMEIAEKILSLGQYDGDLQEVAFESVCDILNLFGSDVGSLKALSFSLSRSSIGAELTTFLQTRVFIRETDFSDETYAVKVSMRRKWLACYCSLVFNGLLPTEGAVYVLKNFADFQAEFSDILKEFWRQLNEENSKSVCGKLVIHSILLQYQDLMKETLPDARNVKEGLVKDLARRFSSYYGINKLQQVKCREDLLQLNRYGVCVAFELSEDNEDPTESLPNLGLLEYLTDFAAKLQKKEKHQVMDYLEKLKVERNVENQKTPAVTTFEAFLD